METLLVTLNTADASCTIESRGAKGLVLMVPRPVHRLRRRDAFACSISSMGVNQLDDAAREVGLNLPLFEFEERRSSTHPGPSSNGDGETKKET